MNWIDIKKKKPKNGAMCYVMNSKWSVASYKAIYYKSYDVFVLYDPKSWDHPALDVTHYIEFPPPPKLTR